MTGRERESSPVERRGEGSIDGLIAAVIETLAEDYQNEVEPFDRYTKRIRLQMFMNIENFNERFVKGYQVIVKELERDLT